MADSVFSFAGGTRTYERGSSRTATREYLTALFSSRIALFDGAMGTMIQKHKLEEEQYRGERYKDWEGPLLKGNNDLLSLTQPQIIKDIHLGYLEAGAQLLGTNTFSATTVAMADYDMGTPEMVREMNLESARLAREAVHLNIV